MTSVHTHEAQNAVAEPPTPDELVRRASALVPLLRERGSRCEELRQLPPETLEDFIDAGFVRSATPVRFGGYGYDPDVVCELGVQLGRGCGSSAWVGCFYPAHQYMVGWFGEEAQAEYWADGPDTLSATASAVRSLSQRPAKGGIRVSARIALSSGIDHSQWIIFHTSEATLLVPRADWRIEDDWFVAGLKGTGSKTVVVEDAFVPEHRILTHADAAAGDYPGASLYDSPWYRLKNPGPALLPSFILAPVIGMAQGIIEIFDERARSRTSSHTGEPAIERPTNQLWYAESSVEVDLARELLFRNLRSLAELGANGGEIPTESRARFLRDSAYACRLCTRAADRLLASGDSGALFESKSLHRLARDLRAGALQYVLNWEEMAIQFARVQWGLKPQTMLI
jgi:alkylation response protein AidB-like acyl-CoA dehydrogenase